MLTDVFFRRYANRPMFASVGQNESALFVQAYRIVNEQLWKYYGYDKKVDESVKTIWTVIHDCLSMEIGVKELSPKYYSYQAEWMGKPITNSGESKANGAFIEGWERQSMQRFYSDVRNDLGMDPGPRTCQIALRSR